MGVVMKRARYFITCNELSSLSVNEIKPENLRLMFLDKNAASGKKDKYPGQLKLFTDNLPARN
jgi:predicted DNA-binding helix-hairpin-helix protein